MAGGSYRDLKVWQAAMDLAEQVCRASRTFPREETFGLGNQVRRAVVSVPSNIAEGQARDSTREFLRFLSVASGSLAEVETQLVLAQRLEYLAPDVVATLQASSSEVFRMLRGLQRSLRDSMGPA